MDAYPSSLLIKVYLKELSASSEAKSEPCGPENRIYFIVFWSLDSKSNVIFQIVNLLLGFTPLRLAFGGLRGVRVCNSSKLETNP